MAPHSTQSGNIFFYIFLGITLFAALGYAISRSSMNANSISDEKARLLATESINHIESIRTAITKIRLRGNAPEKISFENSVVTSWTNSNCTTSDCKVFDPAGGGANMMTIPSELSPVPNWQYSGSFIFQGYGAGGAAPCPAPYYCRELTASLVDVPDKVCKMVNFLSGVTTSPDAAIYTYDQASSIGAFQGTFASGGLQLTAATHTNGKSIICMKMPDIYPAAMTHYYNKNTIIGIVYVN